MQDQTLDRLDAVRLLLARATTVPALQEVIRSAEAFKTYYRNVKDKVLELEEIKLRAERKLGGMLKAAKAVGQITHVHNRPKSVIPDENNAPIKLSDTGISPKESSRAQKLADIPEADFEKKITEQKEAGKLSANTMLGKNGQKAVSGGKRKSRAPKEHKATPIVTELADQGLSDKQIAEQTGVGQRQVRHIVEEEDIRRNEREKIAQEIPPEILSLPDQKKLERTIRQQVEKLNREYANKIEARVQEYLKNLSLTLQKEQNEAKAIMQARKGFMDRVTYKKILVCLHPDWVIDPQQKARYEEAFSKFTRLEKFLLCEKDSPTQFAEIPKTVREWEELKRKETVARKAKHSSKNNLVRT